MRVYFGDQTMILGVVFLLGYLFELAEFATSNAFGRGVGVPAIGVGAMV